MFEGWEAAQIGSDLGYHDLGRPPTEARDGVHPFHYVFDRLHPLGNFAAQLVNQLVQTVQVRQLLGEQETVVRPKLALQGLLQLRNLLPQLVLGQIRQHHRVGGSANQCFQHPPRRHAENVAGDVAELDVGAFQCFLDAVDLGCPLANQGRPIPRELSQLSLWTLGHEAGAQQTVPQQIRDPFTISDIRLATGHLLDVLGVYQQQLYLAFEQIPERVPINPSALEGHLRDPLLCQPVAELEELGRHRAERANLLDGLPTRSWEQYTSHDRLLMYVQ